MTAKMAGDRAFFGGLGSPIVELGRGNGLLFADGSPPIAISGCGVSPLFAIFSTLPPMPDPLDLVDGQPYSALAFDMNKLIDVGPICSQFCVHPITTYKGQHKFETSVSQNLVKNMTSRVP